MGSGRDQIFELRAESQAFYELGGGHGRSSSLEDTLGTIGGIGARVVDFSPDGTEKIIWRRDGERSL